MDDDGEKGTTLSNEGLDIDTPLWGTDLVLCAPDKIRDVHRKFLEAGADIIQTNTRVSFPLICVRELMGGIRYQLTASGLKQHLNLSDKDIEKTFDGAITLCQEAIQTGFVHRTSTIALSLGSFGSTLDGAQEYTGNYPPPYGVVSSLSTDSQSSSFEIGETAVDALMEWHLSRLRIYAGTPGWEHVEWLAFETVPLLSEVKAIRKAMGILETVGYHKKFWITCPFPDGRHPGMMRDGATVTSRNIILSACADEVDMKPADGIGINCTHPRFIPDLALCFEEALRELVTEGLVRPSETTFVLYPDGGKAYDGVTRTWDGQAVSEKEWASGVAKIAKGLEAARVADSQPVWKQVVVGGCCNTSYGHIARLREEIDQLYVQ